MRYRTISDHSKRVSTGQGPNTGVLSILLFTVLFIFGCEQPDGTTGSGVGGGPEGVAREMTFNAGTDTSYYRQETHTGGSAHLYVGSSNGISSEAVLRFNRPIYSGSVRVDSARIELAYQGGIGSGPTPAVEANLVYFGWSESTPPKRTDLAGGRQLPVTYNTGGDSGWMHYAIDTSEVNAWFRTVDSTRADTGWSDPIRPDTSLSVVLRSPAATDKLLRFRSRAATADSLKPYLMLFVKFSDSLAVDTIRVGAISDLFLAEDTSPLPSDRISIGGGAAIRTAMSFQLDSVWQRQIEHHIVVNRAVLTLTRDRSANPWAPVTRSIWPFQMNDKRWMTEPDSAEYSGYVLTPTAIDTTLDTLQLIVSTPTVKWAKGDSTNYGLLLESATEVLDIERISFFSFADPDPNRRPRLTIYFTELAR